MKRTLSLFGLAVLPLLALAACNNADGASDSAENSGTATNRVVQIETMVAGLTAFDDVIQLTGTVEALQDVSFSAEVAGQLTSVAALGTSVSRGATVARTDDRLLRSALDATRAQFELADDTFNRQEALYRDSVISALEFQNARAQRDQMAAMFRQAEKQFEDTQMRSPISGRVEERFAQPGEIVAPGTPVLRIVNTSRVKVRAGIPERYAGDVRKGTSVTADFRAYRAGTREGIVSFVSNVIDPKSRTFSAEVEFDNRDGLLKPEMVAEISIVRSRIEGALVVPLGAVIRDESGQSLFVVVDRDGRQVAERRAITVGANFGGQAVIEEGLAEGEQVVVVGQTNLANGDLVAVEATYESAQDYAARSQRQ